MTRKNTSKKTLLTISILVLITILIILYKIIFLGFNLSMIIPQKSYSIKLYMHATTKDKKKYIKTFLPQNDIHQKISNIKIDSSYFSFKEIKDGINKYGIWDKPQKKNRKTFGYTAIVNTKKISFKLPDFVELPSQDIIDEIGYTQDEKLLGKNSTEINNLLKDLGIDTLKNTIEIIKKVYEFCADSIKNAKFSSNTSAILTIKLREASCNGKSRLMVALLRNRNIPSRLVGGIILDSKEKKTTHQWVEIYIGNRWVTFDPLNKHFAEYPQNYLSLYRGDHPMFQRSANINFKYSFKIESFETQSEFNNNKTSILNILKLWELFKISGISLDVLRILLMIPLGAVVIIIFRNVVGLHTYGTFLPVLIAASFDKTGLFWGYIIFCTIILAGLGIRFFLDKYKLLHSPKLTIILIFVIISLISFTVLGILTNNSNLFASSMFPLAILSITIERFSMIIDTHGFKKAFGIFLNTLIVVGFCYISMLSVLMQSIVMVFPETLLLIAAIAMYLGRWNHIRLMEFIRFKDIIFTKED